MFTLHDNLPTAGRVLDPGIRDLYSLDSRWQSWLDVEAALARSQAELGIIPTEAATAITSSAQLGLLDRTRIDEATKRTGHPLVPLVWELSRVAGAEAGGWVHWGATTQNIVQTGDLLILRRAHDIFLHLIGEALLAISDLAERSANMPIAARTHGQHAVPTTFGYKVAVWIDEFSRHVERLRAIEGRTFVALLGGAAGTFASTGLQGRTVQTGVAIRLGLEPMTVPSRNIGDHLAEYVALLGLVASTSGKIASEIYTLMKTEFGEVEEPMPTGTVGSSTMPQKRNPQLCQDIIARSASIRAVVSLALEAMQLEHEADRSRSLMMQEATETACIAAGDVLSRLLVVISGLRLFPERMQSNLELSNGLIMGEAVMMKLGEKLGRQQAHEIIYDAAQESALTGKRFVSVLTQNPQVSNQLTRDALEGMLDPSSYTGLSADMAHEAAIRGRKVAGTTKLPAGTVGSTGRLS